VFISDAEFSEKKKTILKAFGSSPTFLKLRCSLWVPDSRPSAIRMDLLGLISRWDSWRGLASLLLNGFKDRRRGMDTAGNSSCCIVKMDSRIIQTGVTRELLGSWTHLTARIPLQARILLQFTSVYHRINRPAATPPSYYTHSAVTNRDLQFTSQFLQLQAHCLVA
jgi:hypothetical protein